MNELAKPILPGAGGSDYERYLRTDDLLELQPQLRGLMHRLEQQLVAMHPFVGSLLQRKQVVRPQVTLVVRAA